MDFDKLDFEATDKHASDSEDENLLRLRALETQVTDIEIRQCWLLHQ